jgi:hypothetical protein
VAASSPEQAKNQAETKDRARATKLKAQEELNKKHLQDLITRFGEVGTEGGNTRVGLDQYGNLVLQEFKYNEKGEPVDTREVFFWVADDGIGFQILNGSAAIKKLREGFKGNLESLRKQLYDKQFMSEEEYLSKDENALNKALLSSARNYSTIQVQSYTIDGKTKFTPYKSWLSGIVATRKGDESGYPLRDINLMDRDVVEAIVRDAYSKETDMSPDEVDAFIQQKTDMYMNQIKEGTLTTMTKVGGVNVRKQTKPFSEAQVRAELPGMIERELPGATNMKKSFDFLVFLDQMGAPVV